MEHNEARTLSYDTHHRIVSQTKLVVFVKSIEIINIATILYTIHYILYTIVYIYILYTILY